MRFLLTTLLTFTVLAPAQFKSSDILKLRSVADVQLSPDGTRIVYTVVDSAGPGRPAGDLWVMTIADGSSHKLCQETRRCGGALWSPDGAWIAYHDATG